MILSEAAALAELERAYDHDPVDVDFARFLKRHPPAGDDELAALIDADGRLRIALQRGVEVQRYLEAAPDLPNRPVALDAAIDLTLRSLEHDGIDPGDAVRTLEDNYPDLVDAIRTATLLDEAIYTTGTLTPPRAHLRLPYDLGPALGDGRPRYELRERLGTGGEGSTYLAADRQLSTSDKPAWVVVKVLHHRRDSEHHPAARWTEAVRARRVLHPNVVRALDCGESDDGSDYLVFEHVPGETLGALHARAPLSVRSAAALIAGAARGVHAAHAAGVVHRDLKPDNILVAQGGTPKVADFGAATVLSDDADLVDPGDELVRGNLAFAAPERVRLDADADRPAADTYSLAAMLLWLLTDVLPMGGTAGAILTEAHSGTDAGARWRRAMHRLDPDLAAIVGRSLARDPAARHPSCDALASDLDRFLRDEPLPWAKPTLARRARLLVRRQPVACCAVLAAAGLVLTLSGAGGYALAQSGTSRALAEAKARAANVSATNNHDRVQAAKAAAEAVLVAIRSQKRNTADWYPLMAVLESLWGPTIFDPAQFDGWSDRISITCGLIESARARGAAHEPDVLMWEVGLGYWLLRAGRADEAYALLADNAAAWPPAFAGGAWLSMVECLRDAARVRMLEAQELTGGPPSDELAALRAGLKRRIAPLAKMPYGYSLYAEVYRAAMGQPPDQARPTAAPAQTVREAAASARPPVTPP